MYGGLERQQGRRDGDGAIEDDCMATVREERRSHLVAADLFYSFRRPRLNCLIDVVTALLNAKVPTSLGSRGCNEMTYCAVAGNESMQGSPGKE